MPIEPLLLFFIFFLIALLYSAAGFGGGSTYLAVLSMLSLDFTDIRVIALLCNITVVSVSLTVFYKKGYLDFRRILPLVLFSVPLAFIGARLQLSQEVYFIILGFTLLAASFFMLRVKNDKKRNISTKLSSLIGGVIGFLSGVVGIGGGIFLAPVLYLSHWAKPKTIAATTAFFIFVNSLAGLSGQMSISGVSENLSLYLGLMLAVFLGGQLGARLTAYKLNPLHVRQIAAILIFLAALRILYKYLP